MELTLKYNEHAIQPLHGAFIRGNTPGQWLQEINSWNIPVEQLGCFIISQNNNPFHAAGLFVVFNKEPLPNGLLVRHPYTCKGGKLFIPVDAELSPAITEQELQSLLIWDYQVFHPAIGFTGFEKSDRIALADLLQYPEPIFTDWSYAQPGQAPWVPLHQINVQRLTTEELFETIKESIGSKPLDEIPTANKKDYPVWLNNPISEALLKGILFLVRKLSSLLPAGAFSSGAGGSGNSGAGSNGKERPGLLHQIMNWMADKIEDLERQRDSELKRLSDLFEKNTDEALQYAIPLNSPYMNRGTAQPSGQLTKRPLQFNLNRLGGGQAVDGWNVDKYYNDLRSKYVKAAQQAIEQKDYKKAAYVYAHLLGDYDAAANTLRQGKHFREAAVLYKDHVKSIPLAAACLEEGGLYQEAIELYTSLNKHEKVGDLYTLLEQKERAYKAYEECARQATSNKDFLESARILADKMGERSKARTSLITGWHSFKQQEACLEKYFDLEAEDDREHLPAVIKKFSTKYDPAKNVTGFLHVMDKVNKKYPSPELETTCRNIAYEVVSKQVDEGNAGSLHALRDFVDGDQLLSSDCYRFIHTFKHVPKPKPEANQIQLMSEVVWKKAIPWQNQLLVWGVKSTCLELARINAEGRMTHFSWNEDRKGNSPFLVITDPDYTNDILLYATYIQFIDKWLPKDKYCQDEGKVFQPGFLPRNVIGIGMHERDIISLHPEHGDVFFNRYSMGGELKESHRCVFNDEVFHLPATEAREMIYCAGSFYLPYENNMLRISKTGEMDAIYHMPMPVEKFVVRQRQDGLIIIAYVFDDHINIANYGDNNDYEASIIIHEIIPVDAYFISDDRLVVADKQKVLVYDFEIPEYSSPEIYWQFETENDVVAVFPGFLRNQLGILDANGQITWHTIQEL